MTRSPIALLCACAVTLLVALLAAASWPDAARADRPYLDKKWGGSGFYAGTGIGHRNHRLTLKYRWVRLDNTQDHGLVRTVFKVYNRKGKLKKTWVRSATSNEPHTFKFRLVWKKGRYKLKVRGTDPDGHTSLRYTIPVLII